MDAVSLRIPKKKSKKRKRTVITIEQSEKLEACFAKDSRPDKIAKLTLAKEMGKTENFVSIWFQNRRAREKKSAQRQQTRQNAKSESVSGLRPNPEDAPLDLRKKDVRTENAQTNTPLIDRSPSLSDASASPLTGRSRMSGRLDAMFYRMVRMAAASEGGVLPLHCHNIGQAMVDACRGVRLRDGRLAYHPGHGFEIEEHSSSAT